MKYLIAGKMGQLGREFVNEFKVRGYEFVAFSRDKMDISKKEQVARVFDKEMPDIVINCTAYNNVDEAENDVCSANKTNFIGIENLVSVSKKHNSFLIHYSTDYVFDGRSEVPYREDDMPNPLNNYAKSKLSGEKIVYEAVKQIFVVQGKLGLWRR